MAAFELQTYQLVRDFIAARSIACDWRSFSGVHALRDRELVDMASALLSNLGRTHPHLAEAATLVEGPAGAPALAALGVPYPDTQGAVVQASAASLWPYKLVASILESLLADFPAPSSFNLQTLTPVTNLKLAALSAGGGWSLSTPRGTITAQKVLLATNGYTSRLLPAFADLICPVRGQIGALVPPPGAVALEHGYVFLGALERDEYLVQRPLGSCSSSGGGEEGRGAAEGRDGGGGGELIFGGGRNHARGKGLGEWRDDEVEETVARYLRRGLRQVIRLGPREGDEGGEEELEASYEWTGVMGYSRDGRPWVGPVPASAGGDEHGSLFVCAGYTGHGMPNAPGCGKAVAALMTDDDQAAAHAAMPQSYRVSEERIERARAEWADVAEMDDEGFIAELRKLHEDVVVAGRMD